MSFVTYRPQTGFGTDPALSLSQINLGGAVGLGAQSILNDPSVTQGVNAITGSPVLSPFSVMNLSALSGVFEHALEQPLESATAAVVSALPDSIIGLVGEVVGDVMDIVPVLGPLFKAVFDILSSTFAGEPSYIGSADESRDCQLYMKAFQTPSSGTPGLDQCTTCPSDLFFPSVMFKEPGFGYPCDTRDYSYSVNPDYSKLCCTRLKAYGSNIYPWNIGVTGDPVGVSYVTPPRTFQDLYAYKVPPNWSPPALHRPSVSEYPTTLWRPALGQALMLLTEGAVIDAFEISDPENPAAETAARLAFATWVDQAYEGTRNGFSWYLAMNLGQIPKLSPSGTDANTLSWSMYGGIPPARRAQFRALRRGIQASSSFYGLSDGGVALWPIYMDLLLDSYDLGQITDASIAYSLTYQYLQGAMDQGACWLVDGNGNQITKAGLGIMMNQNLFGNGYMVAGDKGYQISLCAQAVADQVTGLLASWRKATRLPATWGGAQKLAQYAAQAKALSSGKNTSSGKAYAAHINAQNALGPTVPVVKKAHGSAAVLGAAVAAAAIYFFL